MALKRLTDGTIVTIPESEVATGPLYATVDQAKAAFVVWIDGFLDQITAQYPAAVRDLWPEEERMARAYLATPRTATVAEISTLTQDAQAKGRTIQEHCEIIVAKADTFRSIGTAARLLLLTTEKYLIEAQSPDDFPAIIDAGRAQGVALFANYGLTSNDP